MNRCLLLALLIVCQYSLNAQKKPATIKEEKFPNATPAANRLTSLEAKKKMLDTSWLKNIPVRNIGPSVMSGRVTDIAVSPTDPTCFYVAYASGGLWKTTNNGQSFTPLFDHEATITIGAIAVDWLHGETIWLGTGEVNSSRSSYAGVGVYKSTDTGKTWVCMGLPESHHIGKILIDPNQPNTVYVAVLGHLYSANPERGVYKTTDGGTTWKKTLYVDDNTGAVDLAINPSNTKELYASVWHRERRAWNFIEKGATSGIYKSADGGDTWIKLTEEGSGFPTGDGVGRIGITISPTNSNVLYALVDNNFHRPKDTTNKKAGTTFDGNTMTVVTVNRKVKDTIYKKEILTKDDLRTMTEKDFDALDNKLIETYLRENKFPKKYTAESVKQLIKEGKAQPNDLVLYIEDANTKLFDTPVIGAELYRSDDGGKHWYKTHKEYLPTMFNGYGYYFARIAISPVDANSVYLVGFYTLKSSDGGKTFKNILADNVHVDCHSLWVDGMQKGHVILGSDGGITISYDDGAHWTRCNTPAVGQFYSVNIDNATPYNVYGGLQDNGVWYGSSTNKNTDVSWQMDGAYPFKSIMGGDGMQVAVDTTNKIAYTGYQFGNYYKVDITNPDDAKYITPKHNLGERPLRWNWQSPIMLSKYNPGIIYFGSNKLYRSTNAARSFDYAGADLTNGGKEGDVPYGTITTIDESALKFGLIYAGTDDGNVWLSKDAGNTFTKISDKLPAHYWVSRVYADLFDEATVYTALNGYRFDDFAALLFVSHDYGSTWQQIGKSLPLEPVNVVKQDPNNRNILYAGTDNGVYVSLNKGADFMPVGGLPNVAVHDLIINKKEKELVLGTHGRSIYIARVKELEQLTDSIVGKALYVFKLSGTRFNRGWGHKYNPWDAPFTPDVSVPVWAGNADKVHIEVKMDKGPVLYKHDTVLPKGLNYLVYHLTGDTTQKAPYEAALNKASKDSTNKITVRTGEDHTLYLQPGKYTLTITDEKGISASQTFEVAMPKQEGADDEQVPGGEKE